MFRPAGHKKRPKGFSPHIAEWHGPQSHYDVWAKLDICKFVNPGWGFNNVSNDSVPMFVNTTQNRDNSILQTKVLQNIEKY